MYYTHFLLKKLLISLRIEITQGILNFRALTLSNIYLNFISPDLQEEIYSIFIELHIDKKASLNEGEKECEFIPVMKNGNK